MYFTEFLMELKFKKATRIILLDSSQSTHVQYIWKTVNSLPNLEVETSIAEEQILNPHIQQQ